MPTKSAHKSSWKQTQSRVRKGKRVKLALGVLAILILVILSSGMIQLSRMMFAPWRSTDQKINWDTQFNINLVLKNQSISLLSFNPKEKKITLIKIPDQTYLEVPGGFGQWQLSSVPGLDKNGDQLLVKSLTDFLGLPIDGYLDLQSKDDAFEFLKEPFNFKYFSNLKSNLTLWQLLSLKMGMSGVRFDKVNEINLADFLDKSNLADGSEVLVGDPVKIDSALTDLADPTLKFEQKSVAIFNASDKPQLAQKAARLVTNLGGHVIIISNSKPVDHNIVAGESSATLKRLKQIFAPNDTIKDEDVASSRAQINIYLKL